MKSFFWTTTLPVTLKLGFGAAGWQGFAMVMGGGFIFSNLAGAVFTSFPGNKEKKPLIPLTNESAPLQDKNTFCKDATNRLLKLA
jgi:hypothetical protein